MLKNIFAKKSITNKYQNLINQINALETNLTELSDKELRTKTFRVKETFIMILKI